MFKVLVTTTIHDQRNGYAPISVHTLVIDCETEEEAYEVAGKINDDREDSETLAMRSIATTLF